MQASDKRRLGKSGVEVTIMGFGGAPLGNLYEAFSDASAGHGPRLLRRRDPLLRHRAALRLTASASIGSARRSAAASATSFVLSTKVGRLLQAGRPARRSIDGPFKTPAAVRRRLRLLL